MTFNYDLLKSCNPVQGSLQSIGIILPEDVLSLGYSPSLYPVNGVPSLKDGTRIYVVQADKNTSYFTEEKSDSVHGDYYNTKVGFNVRRLRNSIDAVRTLLINRRVHLLIADNGGKVRLLLNVKLTTDQATTDSRLTGRNHYEFAFTGKNLSPTATIPEISTGDNLIGTGGGGTGTSGTGTGGGSTGTGSAGNFKIIPLAELSDGIIVRLRVPTETGYTEVGTMLGTIARYIRQVGEDAEWRKQIGFRENPSGHDIIMDFDQFDDPKYHSVQPIAAYAEYDLDEYDSEEYK